MVQRLIEGTYGAPPVSMWIYYNVIHVAIKKILFVILNRTLYLDTDAWAFRLTILIFCATA